MRRTGTARCTRRAAAALLVLGAGLAAGLARAAAAAPDFTLRGIDGRNVRLAEQRGSVVMLNFWASWCAPCRVEMPHLVRLQEKYRDAGFRFYAVNVDDDPRNASVAVARLGLPVPVLFDADKAVVRRFDVATMPTTVLIDRDGRVRPVFRGYREGAEQVVALLVVAGGDVEEHRDVGAVAAVLELERGI